MKQVLQYRFRRKRAITCSKGQKKKNVLEIFMVGININAFARHAFPSLE